MLPFGALVVVVLVSGAGHVPAGSAAPALNPIQIENSKPGTPGWDQFASVAAQDAISGYASQTSVNHGSPIDLFVTTTAPSFSIDVFRLGWYQGIGARQVAALGTFPGVHNAIPPPDPVTGMVACHWPKTTTLNVPSDWVTGTYVARLTASNNNQTFIYFVVRNDGGTEPIDLQTSATTYQAYNAWGGLSLYTNTTNGSVFRYAHATKVSFDRPYDPLDGNGAGQLFAFDYPFIRWAESQGYDLTYTTDVDTHTNVNPLTNHRVFVSLGHDEYWSKGMRDNLKSAIGQGVNAAFFSANSMFWQIRFEPNDAGVPNRTEVGYKEFATDSGTPGPDPQAGVNNAIVTTHFRDPPVNDPENGTIGVMYQDQVQRDYDYVVQNSGNWIYQGTGFTDGTHVPGIVGYEYDKVFNNGASPPGLTVLSSSPVVGCCEGSGSSTSNSTLYTAPSGAMVFAAGTIQWSWGLDNYSAHYANAGIQKATANILDRFSAPAGPAPSVSFNPTSVGLGSQLVGTTSAKQDVTLTNSGTAPLTISGISITGANAGDFGQTNTCPAGPATLAAGASCTISATFTPTSTGSRTASIQVTDDALGSPQTVPLTGTGTSNSPIVTLSPTSQSFGSQVVGTTTAAKATTLTNSGGGPLTIASIAITGANGGDFAQTNTCPVSPATLAAGASCSISATFKPTATGGRAASVSITDDAAGSPQSIPLSGNGVSQSSGPIAFDRNLGTKTENVGATTMTLTTSGAAAVGSRVFVYVVWNDATRALTSVGGGGLTWSVDVQGKDANNDHVAIASAPAPLGLASGTVLTATFPAALGHGLIAAASFTGVAAGAALDGTATNLQGGVTGWTGSVTTTNPNDLVMGFSAVDANATSTAASPNIEIHDFGDVNYYGWATSAYRIESTTGLKTVNGTWSNATAATANATAVAAYQAAGVSSAPAVTLTPTSFSYGSQVLGTTSSSQSTTLKNSGTAPLTISSIGLTGANAGDYSSSNTCPLSPATLAVNATCTISATFSPSGTGVRSAGISIADDATGSPQTVALSGTGVQPAVSLTPAGLTYASQVVGTTSASQSSTLRNTGTSPLTITSISLIGERSAEFAMSNGCPVSPATLAPNATCSLTVTFTPAGTGARNAAVSIADDAPGSPQLLSLSGTGAPAAPQVSLSPGSLDFGSQRVGTTSAAKTSTLTNTGTAPLNIASIGATGDYGATSDCPASLAAGAGCTISVTFTPSATGSRPGGVIVADDAAGSPQSVQLAGTGTAPAVGLSPTSLDFGSRPVSSTSPAQTSTLTNTGTAPLALSSIGVAGTNAGDFAESNDCPATVVAGAHCTISVTFTPGAQGARSASVQIADDATGSPQALALSGSGTPPAPAVSLSPASLSFGGQRVGTSSATQTVTLTNTGNAPLTVSAIGTTGANSGDFVATGSGCIGIIMAGSNCSITVSFAPTATGSRTASVSVTDDAPGTPHTVSLTGSGTAPAVTVTPATLSYGSQSVGSTSAAQSTTVKNVGTAPLAISGISLGGANPGDFGQTNTCQATLAVNATCAISATFAPTTVGSRTASVSIADDAADSPQTVALAGTGSTSSIAFDKNLGTHPENAGGANIKLTTTAAAAAHSRVIVFVDWNNASRTLTSVSGGGLTWAVDRQVKDTSNYHAAIASADAPSGLPSGTVITASFSAGTTHGLIAAASFTGIAPTSAVDVANSATQSGVAAWSAGVTTTNANDLVVGFSTIDANATSTATAPNTELHDFGDANYFGWATSAYRIESSVGAKTVNGTWSRATGSTANSTAVVAYKAG